MDHAWSPRVSSARRSRRPPPPRVWLQMSTATVYAHRFDAPNDEATGLIGGTEAGVPDDWSYSVDIAKAWEREQSGLATAPRQPARWPCGLP